MFELIIFVPDLASRLHYARIRVNTEFELTGKPFQLIGSMHKVNRARNHGRNIANFCKMALNFSSKECIASVESKHSTIVDKI